MSYEPEGVMENVGDAILALNTQVEASVEDFKQLSRLAAAKLARGVGK